MKNENTVLLPPRKPDHPILNEIGNDITRTFKAILDRYYSQKKHGIETATGEHVIEDLTSQITGSNSHFTLTYKATAKVHAACNLEQLPDAIIMDADMMGFNFTFIPTTRDKVTVEYFK